VADDDGAVPLHDAAAGGYLRLCEMLLAAAPAALHQADAEGDTPLHNAARGGHEDVVALLLSHGADPTVLNTVRPAAMWGLHERAWPTVGAAALQPPCARLWQCLRGLSGSCAVG
jgi:ankyrin repeat protein